MQGNAGAGGGGEPPGGPVCIICQRTPVDLVSGLCAVCLHHDKTGAPRTLFLVWAKIAELLLDTAHLKTIVKAVHDTWKSHESPRAIINDAWVLDHNAVSLQV